MKRRSLSRYRWRYGFAILTVAALTVMPRTVLANPLSDEQCDRLETERKALLVLGIDRYFEKGAEWAKANLTVADFNLVQRYLDVYEQLTFRCQEQIDIVAADEQDDDDEEEGGDAVDRRPPPFPDRRPNSLAKSSLPKHVERAKTVPAKSTATN